MLQVIRLLLLALGLVWAPHSLPLAPKLASQILGQHQTPHKETESRSVKGVCSSSHTSPVPGLVHTQSLLHIPATQSIQPKHGLLHLPHSFRHLPSTSQRTMHRRSSDKASSIKWPPRSQITIPFRDVNLEAVHEQVKLPEVSSQIIPRCVITEVKINTDTNKRPLKVHKGEDVTLYSRVNFDCPSMTKSVRERWQYLRLKHVSRVPDWRKFRRNTKFEEYSNSSTLKMKRSYFRFGVYVFNFSLSITPNPQLPPVAGSDALYVIVERKPLKAVLHGSYYSTVDFDEKLILDGSTSHDPDSGITVLGLTFTWYCTTNQTNYQGARIQVMSKDVCLPEQINLNWGSKSGPVLEIAPQTLSGGREYFFRLEVKKDTRSAFADKVIRVRPGRRTRARILCLENCGLVFILSDRFSLFLNCTNCVLNRVVYQWSFTSDFGNEIPFDWNGLTTTGRNRDHLSVNVFALSGFSESQYFVSVQMTTWNGLVEVLQYPFIINRAPIPGECKITPHKGTALTTKFVIRCRDFKDLNRPLKYKVILSDSSNLSDINSLSVNTMGVTSYFGTDATSTLFLPVGVMFAHYSLKLYVQVYDIYESFSQVTVFTTVVAPTDHLSPETVLQQLHNLTWGPNSTLSDLIQKRDFLGAGYLIYVAASVLNSMRSNLTVQDGMVRLREYLLNQTFWLPLNSLDEITQVVAAVAKLTQRNSDFTEVFRVRCTERISQANQALQRHRKRSRKFHSEQIDAVSTGVLTSLSNLLKLSSHHQYSDEPIYVLDSLADTVLSSIVPENKTTVLQSEGINMYVKKVEKWNVAQVSVQEEGGRNDFHAMVNVSSVPDLLENSPISTTFIEFPEDPFPWISYPENTSSDVVGFRLSGTTHNGDEVEVTPEVVEVYLARKSHSSEVFNITMRPSESDVAGEASKTTTGAFRFEVDCSELKEVLVNIITEVTLLFTVSVYAGRNIRNNAPVAIYLVPHDIPPKTNQSDLFDPNCTVKTPRTICLSPSLLQVIAGKVQSTQCVISMVLQAPRFIMSSSDKLVRISVFRAQCVDMYGIQNEWNEHTCTVGEKTTWQRVHCVCTSKSKDTLQPQHPPKFSSLGDYSHYVAVKIIVTPNYVDLSLDVVKNVATNPVTFLIVLIIMIIYIVLAFWALHRDETDQFLRQHAIILTDNDPYDKTCYLMTVFTGSRFGAGTRANVFVQLQGTESASDVHCLSHPQFLTLYRGSINTFLLTTKVDLGDIRSIRVWHNNEGRSPSWYLSRIKVENLFSRQIWLFICRKWLSVDTSLDRTFYPSQPDQPLRKIDFFLIDMVNNMEKSHLWFSVFGSVISKNFNRLQRLSCCLAILLCFLLCNIMFLELNPSDENESVQEKYIKSIVIGLETALITLPVEMLIRAMFIYSQRSPLVTVKQVTPRVIPEVVKTGSNWGQILEMWYKQETIMPEETETEENLKAPRTSDKDIKQQSTNSRVNNTTTKIIDDVEDEEITSEAKTELVHVETQFVLPSCFVYLAWFLVFATCSISSFFIVFYGLTYGYEKSVNWLFASFCALGEEVFLVQPANIILFAGLQINLRKYCKNLSWVSPYRYTEISLDSLILRESSMAKAHKNIVDIHKSRMYQPLTEDEIEIFKKKSRTKRKAFLFLTYMLSHFVFLALLLTFLSFLHHNDSFYYNQFIWHQFSLDLVTVTKLDDVYNWLHNVPLPLFHNDLHPTFLPDSSSKILGLPQMRQVRAKSSRQPCQPRKYFAKSRVTGEIHCHPEYGNDPEDTKNYTGSWNTVANQALQDNDKGFTYKPPESRWVYSSYGLLHTYGSGGYTVYFFPEEQQYNSSLRIKDLQSSHWLDEKTWAVILELTTLNADTSLLCTISVIFEVSQVGVVNTSLSIHSFSLADFNTDTSSEIYLYIVLLIFLLAYILGEAYVISQERALYVRSVYNLGNFALICLSLVLVVLFIRKYVLARALIQLYLSNPVAFIPFHAVSHVDHIMRVILGFLLFLTVLKTLRYSRIFYSVRVAQRAIQAALPGICHMVFVVSLYVFAFMAFGCLVFGQHEWNYSNFVHSTQTIFSYCVSAFQNTEMSSNRFLGILFLSSFVLLMICILIHLFQAVILSSFEGIKQLVYEEPSEEAEAVSYLFNSLRRAFSFVWFQPESRDEPELFVDMVYGQPERSSHRHVGLKTRVIHGNRRVYLVV